MAETRGEDLARVAHDLRGPLNAILGFAELLHDDRGVTPERQKEYLEEILTSARQMLKVMDGLRGREAGPRATAPRRATHTVLVVDGDRTGQEPFARRLEADGHTVHTAGTTEEALAVLASCRPRVVLVGLDDPGALDLARALRASVVAAETTIVGVSRCDARGSEGVASGCDAFLARPTDPLRLAGLVAGYLWTPRTVSNGRGEGDADRSRG